MIRSMTGYGRSELQNDSFRIAVEIKSVNNRYLDINIKMPRILNPLETQIRKELKKYMERGKVDVFISYQDLSESNMEVKYNARIAREYWNYLSQMAEEFGIENDVRVSSLARFPDVLAMEEEPVDPEGIWENLQQVLIDAAKDLLLGRKMNAKVLDLCCGSGCIACAVGHEFPATTVFAVDNSPSALQVCRKNIADNRMQNHIFTMQADALGFPPVSLNSFDLILCNPPYVPTEEIKTLDISVRNFEPLSALDGGEDGLKFYRAILKYWKSVLRPGGHIMFEVGEDQAQKVWNLMEKEGFFNMYTRTDTLHVERVVVGKLGNEF